MTSIGDVRMLLITGKIAKARKVRIFFVYKIDEIPAIFSNLRDWCAARTRACLLRFSALKERPREEEKKEPGNKVDFC